MPQTFTTQRPLDTTNIPATPAPQEKEEQAGITRIPGSERQALLLRLDLESAKLEELSIRQRAALEEELRYREFGFVSCVMSLFLSLSLSGTESSASTPGPTPTLGRG